MVEDGTANDRSSWWRSRGVHLWMRLEGSHDRRERVLHIFRHHTLTESNFSNCNEGTRRKKMSVLNAYRPGKILCQLPCNSNAYLGRSSVVA